MTGYALPTTTSFVSCSWQCHRDRRPPSSEAGTDYGVGFGQPVFAPADGVITAIKTTNSGAMGRFCQLLPVDGQEMRSIHMQEVWVQPGLRVSRKQLVGLSGASGFGSDWYYGPHVHQTLWPGRAWAAATIDFARHVGPAPAPEPTPPSPKRRRRKTMSVGVIYTEGGTDKDRRGAVLDTQSGRVSRFSYFAPSYADGLAVGFGLERAAQVTNGQFDILTRDFTAQAGTS